MANGSCPKPYKLHLGCGRTRQDGWVNCDLYPGPHVDAAFSVEERWPFPDNSGSEIYSSHMLEHLTKPKAFFQEAHRVLQPNGSMLLRLPYGGHRAAWWDLEHIRPWYAENFAFLQPGYARAIGNPQHDDWQWPFAVHQIQLRVSYRLAQWLKRRWWLWLFTQLPSMFDSEVEEMWVHLSALKTPEALEHYTLNHQAFIVPVNYAAWGHHLLGRNAPQDGRVDLVNLNAGVVLNGFIGSIKFQEPNG